jgi:GDPmannose 4,6-dehydratase
VRVDPDYYRPTEVDLLLGDATKARELLGWESKTALPALVGIMVDHDLDLAATEARMSRRGTG